MMKRIALALAAATWAILTGSASAQGLPPGRDAKFPSALQAKAERSGKVRVIVEFAPPSLALPNTRFPAEAPAFVAELRRAQNEIISAHFANGASTLDGPDRALKRMDFVPQFAINVTASEIRRLAADPRVRRIHEDRIARPTLRQSISILNMTGVNGAFRLPNGGAKGQGRVVAVLDTGVLKTHEFLKGKVISEACFNSNVPSQGAKTRCPGRVLASTAAGSAADCPPSTAAGCGHGTHVAGIAAGFNTSGGVIPAGEPVVGVAPSAKILAINVFSLFDKDHSSKPCGIGAATDCLASYSSDQIKALERVYALRYGIVFNGFRFRIDAANMSLGGGRFTAFCNDDPLKPIIYNLRLAGIATVIASGNSGFTDAVSAPGCIQWALTIGASSKRAGGYPERMAFYTNQGRQVDALAPGGDDSYPPVVVGTTKAILSSLSTGGYGALQGTSMAAPHVAGAIAAMRSRPACRSKTVGQIESALAATGPLITDHRIAAGLRERRIDVPALMKKLGCFS